MTNVLLYLNNSNKCTYPEQHPSQVQSQHLLFLHLDPTACHVSSISSLQWVIPMSEKKDHEHFSMFMCVHKEYTLCLSVCIIPFFSPYV